MEERYNVYFAGQVMAGFDARVVRDKLAKIFNADQATLDKLFSGKAQLIKRDCDAATAEKYKQALERAGAIPIIKTAATAATTAAPAPANSPSSSPTNPPARAMTAAEKIAALAAAPDETRYQQRASDSAAADHRSNTAVVRNETGSSADTDTESDNSGIVLAPPGTAVLREEERAAPVVRAVDTSGLAIDATATRLSDEPPPPPAAPDTRHLSMGAVGDTIPTLPSAATPLSPNLDGLALSAAGTDFSDCAPPAAEALPLDLSHLAALPPGDIPLEEQRRRPLPVATPDTDHISLQE
ncbi:MAG: hypothetical protein IPG64_12020 [Haliea sp.]|nr:hypothetical protein [Haliea sp.]